VKKVRIKFEDWLQIGVEQGWCGPAVCYTHDGLPMSDEELESEEPCISIIRLYEDAEIKNSVELSHSPSVWRK